MFRVPSRLGWHEFAGRKKQAYAKWSRRLHHRFSQEAPPSARQVHLSRRFVAVDRVAMGGAWLAFRNGKTQRLGWVWIRERSRSARSVIFNSSFKIAR